MPTMPLNQLTFLFQVLAVWFAVISGRIECQSHGHLDLRSEAGFSPQRECDSLTPAWLDFHCTVSAHPTPSPFCLATPKRSRHSTGELFYASPATRSAQRLFPLLSL